jgi:hypothetical protein
MFRETFCPSSEALLNCGRSLQFPYKSRVGCVSSRGLFVNKQTTAGNTPQVNFMLIKYNKNKLNTNTGIFK